MTARKQSKTGVRKAKKLGLNKLTLRDLNPRKGHANAVAGGRQPEICTGKLSGCGK